MMFEHANAAQVTPTLWTGGQLLFRDRRRGLAQLSELVDAGLTHIVDLRLEWDDSMFVNLHAPQVRYTWLGIGDAGQTISDEWWELATRVVRAALSEPSSRVLVHCAEGVNRGPSLAFATLISSGRSPLDALDAIVAARPHARIVYAENAVEWRMRVLGLTSEECAGVRASLEAWRDAHPRTSEWA